MDPHFLLERALYVIPLILSLTVHEFSHAWSAYLLGDDTAAMQGRMTLNPLVHIDPVGTFLLPLLGIPFGWARPVPVNPARFKRKVHMGTGMMITAIAGPASNVLLAVLCAVALGLLMRLEPGVEAHPALFNLLVIGMQMNVALAIFNMLPIPPLDGSRVVERLIPYAWRSTWTRFSVASPFLLFVVLASGVGITRAPTEWASAHVERLVWQVAHVGLADNGPP